MTGQKGKPKKLLTGGGTGPGQQGPALPTLWGPPHPLAHREATGFMLPWQTDLQIRTEAKYISVDFIQKNKAHIHNSIKILLF